QQQQQHAAHAQALHAQQAQQQQHAQLQAQVQAQQQQQQQQRQKAFAQMQAQQQQQQAQAQAQQHQQQAVYTQRQQAFKRLNRPSLVESNDSYEQIDSFSHRDLAISRFRLNHELMAEVFSPHHITQYEKPAPLYTKDDIPKLKERAEKAERDVEEQISKNKAQTENWNKTFAHKPYAV
ncbi:hypothetical protein E3P86_02073, partial [Wallemia ichthyophaga]